VRASLMIASSSSRFFGSDSSDSAYIMVSEHPAGGTNRRSTFLSKSKASGARACWVLSGWMTANRKTYEHVWVNEHILQSH